MESLEERIAKIEQRNKSVELDKAWETSWTRILLIIAFTYIFFGIFFQIVGVPRAWINALVPAIAFALSSLTMPFIKRVWIERRK